MNAQGTRKVVFAAHGATFLTAAPTTQQLIDAVKPGTPIWTHFLFPRTLLSEPRALHPGMSPIQHR